MRLEPAKLSYFAICILAGAVPASFWAISSCLVVIHGGGWLRLWGVGGIVGTLGLWVVLFHPPWRSISRLRLALIAASLVIGVAAMAPVLRLLPGPGARPPLEWATIWLSTCGPIAVALGYIAYGIVRRRRIRLSAAPPQPTV